MNETPDTTAEDRISKYVELVVDHRSDPEDPIRGGGKIGPEYWADAPWRLEPGQKRIPLTFIARDAVDRKLEKIKVYKCKHTDIKKCSNGAGNIETDGDWSPVYEFLGPGEIKERYWSYTDASIPRPSVYEPGDDWTSPGKWLRLKVVFWVDDKKEYEQDLVILVAKEPLPLRDSPQWCYGDTHYHSDYTNDIKEFGNPVRDTRDAALSIGMEWLIITDHSVDLHPDNPYWENGEPDSRWKALGNEVETLSNERFRLVRGEEVTVSGEPGEIGKILHLLVFGEKLERLIPGAFWESGLLQKVASVLPWAKDYVDYIFGDIFTLREVLTGRHKDGSVVQELKGRSVQEQGCLAFSAHPTYGLWNGAWEDDDLELPVQGMEAWNGRSRHRSKKEENPFDAWDDYSECMQKEIEAVDRWDQMLIRTVDRDDPRYVLLAGSDAHGSFNYSVGIPFLDRDLIGAEDNCFGKVRTLLYLPHRSTDGASTAPSVEEIMTAIRLGSCVVTDGPVLNFTAAFNGREKKLGEILDQVSGDGNIKVRVQATSTEEFGLVEQVTICYYFKGMLESRKFAVELGKTEIVQEQLPAGSGYVRVEAETTNGAETFRCATNPIWIQASGPGVRQLAATFVD